MAYFNDLLAWIKETKPDKDSLAKKKVSLCKEHGRKAIPTDIEVLMHAEKEDLPHVKPYLQTKPVRTGSGVAVVATMTKPYPCPHGTCTYCPGGPDSSFGDTPKSYTGKEPSTMRGERQEYDPYRIVFNRLEQYVVMGQNPDKVEQIVMGGTFPALPEDYQEEFVRLSFKAYNDFSEEFFPDGEFDLERFKDFFKLPGRVNDPDRTDTIKRRVLALKRKDEKPLREEHALNEEATIRCVGLTIETKPDHGFKEHGRKLLDLGVTRIELGVQTTRDDILEAVHRGHTVEDTKRSFAELRDLGFKLNAHMMPGLPGKDGKRINIEEDKRILRELFDDEDYRPDMLKLYPCMVMPGTALEKDYEKGVYEPLTSQEAIDVILDLKQHVPEWCRIMRIQRDIPTDATTAGVDKTNLRQMVHQEAKKQGVTCRCIRCREVRDTAVKEEPHVKIQTYKASNGTEHFISMEAEDKLLGFVRLRLPARSLHPAITEDTAIVRELHVYGQAVLIGKDERKTQHRGVGKKLMEAAEETARKACKTKIAVISGVGVRGYYRKLGYEQEGPYMTKQSKRKF
ncbi:MAG: tRNA uridine(34) 5-carboxymethylaminomethyl modification radical SAM/GNAT enzyme Elp3 [Candidatus Woesearchaeota archaeon]